MIAKERLPQIIIIHGTRGRADGNWFPWLKEELNAIGYEAVVPTFPTPEGQSLDSWKKVFFDTVGPLRPDIVLVGHSIGSGFILNLLEESLTPVLGSFLVCGFLGNLGLPRFDTLNQSFVCRDFNWQKIRNNMGRTCFFASDNDPYVPIEKSKELGEKLQIPLTILPGAKHINAEAGYTKFPLLLEKIRDFLAAKSAVERK